MRSRHGQRCCLGALCLASPAITTHTHVHPPAARDLAPRHPSILDPTPQKSLTQSNPRSWNLRRRAGRWDRSVRALIRRAPRACSEAFWKRRWQTLAVAGVRCTMAQSSQPPGPTARISCCDILPPGDGGVRGAGRQRKPSAPSRQQASCCCCFGRATALGWRRRGKCGQHVASSAALHCTTRPLPHCSIHRCNSPFDPAWYVSGLSLAD